MLTADEASNAARGYCHVSERAASIALTPDAAIVVRHRMLGVPVWTDRERDRSGGMSLRAHRPVNWEGSSRSSSPGTGERHAGEPEHGEVAYVAGDERGLMLQRHRRNQAVGRGKRRAPAGEVIAPFPGLASGGRRCRKKLERLEKLPPPLALTGVQAREHLGVDHVAG